MGKQRDWKRLEKIMVANQQEWERLIGDPDLQSDLSEVRARYGLPFTFSEHVAFLDRWRESGGTGRDPLSREAETLLERHNIPEKWRGNLLAVLVYGSRAPLSFHKGLPRVENTPGKDGKRKQEIIIDETTDVTNPIVLDFINQMKYPDIDPPRPQPGYGRALDWRPVWEWHKQHPDVKLSEIADKLGYTYGYLRKKLLECDIGDGDF